MDRIEKLALEKGMRMTEQRRVVARVLSEAEDHPDVEELYRRASAVDPHVSIATVYRTVRLFEDAGIVERHDFRDGRSRYEQATEYHHHHLIDLNSGEVTEFFDAELEALKHRIAERMGYASWITGWSSTACRSSRAAAPSRTRRAARREAPLHQDLRLSDERLRQRAHGRRPAPAGYVSTTRRTTPTWWCSTPATSGKRRRRRPTPELGRIKALQRAKAEDGRGGMTVAVAGCVAQAEGPRSWPARRWSTWWWVPRATTSCRS
jgi:Fur family ferric uptake transcriptional regulator